MPQKNAHALEFSTLIFGTYCESKLKFINYIKRYILMRVRGMARRSSFDTFAIVFV